MSIASPLKGSLVSTMFQLRIGASVYDSQQFSGMNKQFHLCQHSYLLESNGSESTIFSKCGLEIFDTNRIVAKPGKNRLVANLIHIPTQQMLCSAEVIVECCQREDTSQFVQLIKDKVNDYVTDAQQLIETDQIHVLNPLTNHLQSISNPPNTMKTIRIFIGIKTFALNIHLRNAIRKTYFNYFRHPYTLFHTSKHQYQIYPSFLIGYNPMERENIQLTKLLREEKALYADMLLPEDIPVLDTYFTLPDKVLYYFHYLQHQYFQPDISAASRRTVEHAEDFVLISDDDTYLHIPQLLTLIKDLLATRGNSRYTFYGGEVLEERMHFKYRPQRSKSHLNYIPYEEYSLDTLPPFALGNFYLLSSYLMFELLDRKYWLQPIGTLEDLSIGIWIQKLFMKENHVHVQHLSGVCDLSRCVEDLKLFHTPDFYTSKELFLAIAGIREERHYQLLHAVFWQHPMGWSGRNDIINLISVEAKEEVVSRLREQYKALLHTITQIRIEQVDVEALAFVPLHENTTSSADATTTSTDTNKPTAIASKAFTTSKMIRPYPLLPPSMTVGLHSHLTVCQTSLDLQYVASSLSATTSPTQRRKTIRIVILLAADWFDNLMMRNILTWMNSYHKMQRTEESQSEIEYEFVTGSLSMQPSIYYYLQSLPYPITIRYFAAFHRENFHILEELFSPIILPIDNKQEVQRNTIRLSKKELLDGLVCIKHLMSFDLLLLPDPISFEQLTEGFVYTRTAVDTDYVDRIFAVLLQYQLLLYSNYRRREDFVGKVPQFVVLTLSNQSISTSLTDHLKNSIPKLFRRFFNHSSSSEILRYDYLAKAIFTTLSSYWTVITLFSPHTTTFPSAEHDIPIINYLIHVDTLTKVFITLHEEHTMREENLNLRGNPITLHKYEEDMLYTYYAYSQLFYHHYFTIGEDLNNDPFIHNQLYLPYYYRLPSSFMSKKNLQEDTNNNTSTEPMQSEEDSTVSFFPYDDYLLTYYGVHHWNHQLNENTMLLPYTMMFQQVIILIDNEVSRYTVPWMLSLLRQYHPSWKVSHFYQLRYELPHSSTTTNNLLDVFVQELEYQSNTDTLQTSMKDSTWHPLREIITTLYIEQQDSGLPVRILSLSTYLDCAQLMQIEEQGKIRSELIWTEESQYCYHRKQQALQNTLIYRQDEQTVSLGKVISFWFSGEPQEILPWYSNAKKGYLVPDIVFIDYKDHLTTNETVQEQKKTYLQFYLPVFATLFFEGTKHRAIQPYSLLISELYLPDDATTSISIITTSRSTNRKNPVGKDDEDTTTSWGSIRKAQEILSKKTHGIAYLYYRCDRYDREQLFTLLRQRFAQLITISSHHENHNNHTLLHAVDALGHCQGNYYSSDSSNHTTKNDSDRHLYATKRFSGQYNNDAITHYQPYKFIIAVENTYRPGYITEKLLHAYYAHAIPIYLGDPSIHRYFAPQSMINCHTFVSIEACVEHVVYVHEHEEVYLKMLRASPIQGKTIEEKMATWSELFAWHESSSGTNAHRIWKQRIMQKMKDSLFSSI